jgi:hypothetical protein
MTVDPEAVFAANRRYWDRSTPRKMAHGSYPLAAFRAGESNFGADERHYLTHHRLGDVVTALASAGLRVEFLREHPFDYWRRWERMVRDDAGRWRLPDDPIPLTFSLRARPA